MLADVALPVGVDREFTYLVPPDLAEAAVPGVRVIVPFGRRHATGLIVRIPEATAVKGLRPIMDILDAEPVVSAELLHLCLWIAEYYLAPPGDVLKTALPHGFAEPAKRKVSAGPALTDERLEELRRRAPRRAELLDIVRAAPLIPVADLQKRTKLKTINAVLAILERQGFVVTEEVFHRRMHAPKTVDTIPLKQVDRARITESLSALSPRKQKARALLDVVLRAQGEGRDELTLKEVLAAVGTPRSTAQAFIDAGVLPVSTRDLAFQEEYGFEEFTRTIRLNADQQRALNSLAAALEARQPHTFLLQGVTGSGKTQVYIEAIKRCLASGRSAIVLVPEISLTPQTVRRFRAHFADEVMTVHSRMTPSERTEVWRRAARGSCKIVIGPRSAIFAPLKSLGLIVVDEEHESSYKQFDASPRYHARDVAVVRGAHAGAVVVLGSATPSVESYANALSGKYSLLELPTRIDDVPLPAVTVVDMTADRKRLYAAAKALLPPEARAPLRKFQQPALSDGLRAAIGDRISRNEGVILLQNRRGFAPFVECGDCGHAEECENCQVTMTYHLSHKHLRCHYCGSVRPMPERCPSCQSPDLDVKGVGTQRVEQELAVTFPSARVLRMDLDTTSRKGAHDRLLRKFGSGDADILLGTQMVAKGLDFPRVTLVGVISADTQLLLPDFRASERTFHLLTQVAGRAGRSTLKGEVIIQTHQPGHEVFRHVLAHDVKSFLAGELEYRKELDYPPATRLVLVEVRSLEEPLARRMIERFADALRPLAPFAQLLGPAPAVIARINRMYRWHLVIKNSRTADASGARLRQALGNTLRTAAPPASVKIAIDIDPVGIL
ncbi:MAG: primosomal protein [candidate division NC10 bacterium]|nr:primosomal protein [candidate division NC10 bacterium]